MERESFGFRNRDGKIITFTYQGDGKSVVMTDYGQYVRMGSHKEEGGEIHFIDPSGGPFIFVGMDFNDIIYNGAIKPFLNDPFKRIVTKITSDLLGVTITFNKEEKKKEKKEKGKNDTTR